MAILAALCLFVLIASMPTARAATPKFSGPAELTSDTGQLLMAWQSDEPVVVSIATSADFGDATTVYEGAAHSFFLSGLKNGDYYLRLRAQSGAVSQPLRLSVTHQSLTRAAWLLLIGSLITLAIVVTIVRGPRDA